MIDDVYGICEKSDSVLVEGQELAPWEILAQFLQGMLKCMQHQFKDSLLKSLYIAPGSLSNTC